MPNLLYAEFIKFKRRKIFLFGILAALIFPVFNSALLSEFNFASIQSGVREDNAFLLLMPMLIILAANLFFVEQDNNTLKNLLCIPIPPKKLVIVKLLVLLLFSITFQITGFAVSTVIAVIKNIPIVDPFFQFFLTVSTGILIWAAALPCIVLVIWFNKSYLLSIIIVFFYTLTNYVMHFSDAIMMQPIGLNAGTLMPVPMIFRWLYQFYKPAGDIQTAFYKRFSQYFASTPICFFVLLLEAFICIYIMFRIYDNREN
ncbi:ABC transporter permease [Lacrimispora amygdalina]|uniref:ABC transporter permease n=1 Tax=Lacrimispora amygdalina TaxID=253257 RepID=UPI000BE2E1DB|nr:ABC transporter permease [Lacrimispora amygdalina]